MPELDLLLRLGFVCLRLCTTFAYLVASWECHTSLWEQCHRAAAGELEASETRLVWKHLKDMFPELAVQAATQAENTALKTERLREAKRRVLDLARGSLFRRDAEAAVTRPLAVRLGFLSPALDVEHAGDRVRLVQSSPDCEAECEALTSPVGSDGFVRASRVRAPADAPKTVYEALFADHDAYDGLRAAFFTGTEGAAARVSEVRSFLGEQGGDGRLAALREALGAWLACLTAEFDPTAFAARAWSALVAAARLSAYWLSVDELLAVCAVRRQPVIIGEHVANFRLTNESRHLDKQPRGYFCQGWTSLVGSLY